MYCRKCGSEIKNGAKFCIKCGTPVSLKENEDSGDGISVRPDHYPVISKDNPEEKQQGRSNKIFVIIIAVLAVLIIGIAAFLVWKLVISADEDKGDNSERIEREYEESNLNADRDNEGGEEKKAEEEEGKENEDQEDTAYDAFTDYARDNLFVVDDFEDHEVYCYKDSNGYGYSFGNTDLTGKNVNYIIKDFDGDLQDEMLVVGLSEGCIRFDIYEYEGEKVVFKQSRIFEDDNNGEVINGAEGVTEVYIIDDTRIMIEESYIYWLYADGVSIGYTIIEYNDGFNVIDKDRYNGSDGEYSGYGSHFSKARIGETEWNTLFARQKHMHDYIGEVEGIARFETVHCVTPEQFQDWSQYGTGGLSDPYTVSIIRLEKEINDNKPGKLVPMFSRYYESAQDTAYNRGFILPDSDSRYLDKSELYDLSKEECRLARNEIYARLGRKFDDEGLRNYFEQFDWYQGRIDADDFSESLLNEYEKYNRDLITEYEKEMGYR